MSEIVDEGCRNVNALQLDYSHDNSYSCSVDLHIVCLYTLELTQIEKGAKRHGSFDHRPVVHYRSMI